MRLTPATAISRITLMGPAEVKSTQRGFLNDGYAS